MRYCFPALPVGRWTLWLGKASFALASTAAAGMLESDPATQAMVATPGRHGHQKSQL